MDITKTELDQISKLFDLEPSDIPVPNITPHIKRKNIAPVVSTGSINDFILGAVTDYEWEDISPWYNSLKKTGYSGNIALLVYNMSKETLEKVVERGIKVWAVGKPTETGLFYKNRNQFNICVDRFYHLWMFLNSIHTNRIICTDIKDVVFQSNPMLTVSSIEKDIIVTSESVLYEDEAWGRNNLQKSFGETIYKKMAANTIFNAGVIAGHGKTLSDMFLNIYLICAGRPPYIEGGGGPDQAALNVLLSMKIYAEQTEFMMLDRVFACQAGTTNDPTKSMNLITPVLPFLTEDGVVYPDLNGEHKIFPIVHQYDRVPEWKKYFEGKFKDG